MRNRFALALLALLLVAGGVVAAVDQENYAEVKRPSSTVAAGTTFPSLLTALDGTDSTTWNATTALTGRRFPTYKDPLVAVHCRLSSESATATVVVGYRDGAGNFRGIADVQTATAGSGLAGLAYDGTGYWTPQPLYFALNGWSHFEVRCYDVSGSNTVTLLPVTVGATGAAAE